MINVVQYNIIRHYDMILYTISPAGERTGRRAEPGLTSSVL